jgi:hypothetical protein
MKNMLVVILGAFCTVCHAQLSQETVDAMTWGAKTKLTLHVVDYEGQSVSNANVRIFWTYDYTNKQKRYEGKTDAHGLLVLEVKSRGTFTFFVENDGYYRSQGEHSFDVRGETRVKDGRWEPWNPTVKIVLKEKREPVPLEYIRGDFVFPCDTIVGFDFVKGDLVKPHGTGVHPDITVFYTVTNPANRFSIAMTNQIRVAASANEGFLLRAKDTSSKLLSAYEAPEYGYEQSLVYGRKSDEERILERTSLAESDYLFFKTRVETNDQGKVVSARYGKIYRFEYSNANPREYPGYGRMRLGYYINPEANNRNLEWDGHDLRSGRKVDVDKVIGGF